MYITVAGLLGALLGSFLNVVISRGPRAWGLVETNGKPSGLALPPSQCEACGHRLGPLDLIPVLSFIALRGRCRYCSAPIGARHVIVELLGAAIVATAVAIHGISMAAALLALVWLILLALSVIDWETGFLPDALTLPLLGGGIVASAMGYAQPLFFSLAGAAIGGGSLWLIGFLYKRFRGREGMGGGDVKLLGAAGAWLGPLALPYIALIASFGGLLYVGLMTWQSGMQTTLSTELRFGPFLAGATAIAMILPMPA
ncbi:MAG: prepilin peptidase [Parvularculaceae bacterium]|nr:prepilin peptidase [Parvularculaceae bacterium]